MKKEKKVSNTRYVLEPHAKEALKNIKQLLQTPKKHQQFIFNSNSRGVYVSEILHYTAIGITDGAEKVHVVERRNRVMRGSNGTLFIKGGNAVEGVTYNKKGRASSKLTVWGRHNIPSIMHTSVFKYLVETVNPSAQELLDNEIVKKIATKGLIGSILAGNITTKDQAMKYRITYLLKRSCGIQKEDSEALYHFYKEFGNRLEAEKILYNSLDPRAVVNLFDPLFGDHTLRARLITDHKLFGDEIHAIADKISKKVDWTGMGFNPKEFLDRISRKEKGIKDIVHLWGGGPVLSRNSRQVNYVVDSSLNDLPF
jgi:hypothetical protein